MKLSYLLKPKRPLTQDLERRFRRLRRFSKRLCNMCSLECKSFMLTTESTAYYAHKGPKIGWGYYGDIVLMRVANCENLHATAAIEEFIEKEGFEMTKVSALPLV